MELSSTILIHFKSKLSMNFLVFYQLIINTKIVHFYIYTFSQNHLTYFTVFSKLVTHRPYDDPTTVTQSAAPRQKQNQRIHETDGLFPSSHIGVKCLSPKVKAPKARKVSLSLFPLTLRPRHAWQPTSLSGDITSIFIDGWSRPTLASRCLSLGR